MPRRKVSNAELERLVKEGNGLSEIAKKLGVAKSTVWKRMKSLQLAYTKDVTWNHAHEAAPKQLDAAAQLLKINDHANEMLENCMAFLRGDADALHAPEFDGGKQDPMATAIKLMGEIRSQLKLQLEIFSQLYSLKAAAEFQQEVITAIGEASPEVRDAIVRKLAEKRAIRSTLEFHPDRVQIDGNK